MKGESMISYLEVIRLIKKLILILLLGILITSCQEKSHFIKVNHYSSGELLSEIPYLIKDSLKDGKYKEYYRDGQVKKIIFFKNGEPVDSAMQYFESGELKFKEIRQKDTVYTTHFYKSGNVAMTAKFLNTDFPVEIGWAKILKENGRIKDSLQYINLKGKGFLNQRIHYDENQKVVLDSSYFYKFKISKIENSESFRLKIDYVPSIKNAQVSMVVGENINADFSNFKEVKLDTIFMDKNRLVTNNLKEPFRDLKGYFHEYYASVKDTIDNDSIRMTVRERKTFFNQHVKMTDTISVDMQ